MKGFRMHEKECFILQYMYVWPFHKRCSWTTIRKCVEIFASDFGIDAKCQIYDGEFFVNFLQKNIPEVSKYGCFAI